MKKVLALVLPLIIILCACGAAGDKKVSNTTVATNAPTTAADSTKAPDGTAKPAASFTVNPSITADASLTPSVAIIRAFKNAKINLGMVVVYTSKTDPDLGKPGKYIEKTRFAYAKLQQPESGKGVNGGTIEVYKTKADMEKRLAELKKLNDESKKVNKTHIYSKNTTILVMSADLQEKSADVFAELFKAALPD